MRSSSLLVCIALVAACGDDDLAPPVFEDLPALELRFPSTPIRELDLLFVIDNSPNVADKQANLAANLAVMFDALTAVDGTLPSLHIGVITSDLGTLGAPAIGNVGIGGCAGQGDDGQLQPYGAPLHGVFLVDIPDGAGGRTRNYEGPLLNTLATMLRGPGAGGCAFEQPLAALRRSLTHPANAGFFRPTAHLGVILLTDEDDCSFLDPAMTSNDPALGPLSVFRCATQGITCNEPVDEVGTKTGCRSNEDSAYVEPIALTEAALRELSPSGGFSFATMSGPRQPFSVSPRSIGGGAPQLALDAACRFTGATGPEIANPAVRVRELAARFGGNGTSTSICQMNLTDALREVTRLLEHPLGVVCLDTTRLRDSDTAAVIQPTCTVTDATNAPIPSMIVEDAAACPETPDHLRLVVDTTAATGMLTARCEVP